MPNLEKSWSDVDRRVDSLSSLSRQELRALWREFYGREAPSGLRRELLIPFLAFRIQERAFGGLKPSTRAELRRITAALEQGKEPSKSVEATTKSGTRFVRVWRGNQHEVLKTESGFEYCGASHRSLSEIARKITGTRWSGPAFFGLRKQRAPENTSNG
jgi:hypothetical protein